MKSLVIDFNEDVFVEKYPGILEILLIDRSSNSNIKWCTDAYEKNGNGFLSNDIITLDKITGVNSNLIMPRVSKNILVQKKRSMEMAEVFTPAWVCNKQNNFVDEKWFGYQNVFNFENGKSWKPSDKVIFPKDKSWEDYVLEQRIEITCGEAPYLTSRYDASSGKLVDIKNRIGLLDRKLRVINENATSNDEWLEKCFLAYKSIFAYDYQGDNVLLSRENLLATFFDNYIFKFSKEPSIDDVKKVAIILSWNIWQMDGLKLVVPNSCKSEKVMECDIFGEHEVMHECEGCTKNDILKHNGIYCKLMDWEQNRTILFKDLLKDLKNGY